MTISIWHIIVLIAGIAMIPGVYGFVRGIGYAPSLSPTVNELKALLRLKKGDMVYDFGTGTGTLLFALLKAYPEAQGKGFDLFWPVWIAAWARSWFYPNGSIHFADFFRVEMKPCTHIVCFLHPKPLAELRELWEAQCAPGTLVASCTFPIKGWENKEIQKNREHKKVYLYKI